MFLRPRLPFNFSAPLQAFSFCPAECRCLLQTVSCNLAMFKMLPGVKSQRSTENVWFSAFYCNINPFESFVQNIYDHIWMTQTVQADSIYVWTQNTSTHAYTNVLLCVLLQFFVLSSISTENQHEQKDKSLLWCQEPLVAGWKNYQHVLSLKS